MIAPEEIRPQHSVLTPIGRGAIAVVAVAGSGATEVVDRLFDSVQGKTLAELPLGRILYGHWGGPGGEDLVVCRLGPDHLEIHCHGGSQSVARIVEDLSGSGSQTIDWREWLAREKACPLARAAQLALASATTFNTARVLLDQYHGALRKALERICSQLGQQKKQAARASIVELLSWAKLGMHLTRPFQVVLAGRPNAGKSSLINALVGYQRAIVADVPGTTRDVVAATTAVDGWPIQLSDTAGLHHAEEDLERAGISLALERLKCADLVLWLIDAGVLDRLDADAIQSRVREQIAEIAEPFEQSKVLPVLSKSDLCPGGGGYQQVLATSATTGAGIAEVLFAVRDRLVPQAPPSGSAVPFTSEQVAQLESSLTAIDASQCERAADDLRSLWQIK